LAIGVPSLAAAALALGAGAALTGALHEDGLADVGDGFGGGRDRAAKLSIMRDSRLGTYGMIVLLVGFIARASALASLPLAMILPALIVAHALGRAVIPVLAANMPFARDDGLGKSAGRPDNASVVAAVIFGIVIALLCLTAIQALLAVVVAAAGAAAIAVLAWRQIGGVTGDVFGAAEQVVEAAVLVMLAAQHS
jgi:adenosylcobinamide-GDP ribazoletransferase